MSRRDDLHYAARNALEKDGWTITDDPLELKLMGETLRADLGAERTLAAEKEGRKIAVEIKGFDGNSPVSDLEKTVGQMQFYQWALDEQQPDRELFLAISEEVYIDLFSKSLFIATVERNRLNLLIFDKSQEVILQWLKQ